MSDYDEYQAEENLRNNFRLYIKSLREKAHKNLSNSSKIDVTEENIELTSLHTLGKYWNIFLKTYSPSKEKKVEIDWEKVGLNRPRDRVTVWKNFKDINIKNDRFDFQGLIELDAEVSAILNKELLQHSLEHIVNVFEEVISQKKYDRTFRQINSGAYNKELNITAKERYEDVLSTEIVAYKYFYDNKYNQYIESVLDTIGDSNDIISQIIEIYDAGKGSYINSKITDKFRYGGITNYGTKYREEILTLADLKIEKYKSEHDGYPHEIIWDYYKSNYKNLFTKEDVLKGLRKMPLDISFEFRFNRADDYYIGGNMTPSEYLNQISVVNNLGYGNNPNSEGIYKLKTVFYSDIPLLNIPNWVKGLVGHNYSLIVREAENEIREINNRYKVGRRWTSESEVYDLLRNKLGEDFRIIREKWISIMGAKKLDFYLPDPKIAIEYNGIQHYEPIDFFGGNEGLKKTRESDRLKKLYCQNQGIKLYVIRFDEDTEKKVSQIISGLV